MTQIEDLEAFYNCVLEDLSLQTELKSIGDLAAFVDRVVAIGRERGFEFERENVEDRMRRNRQAWIERWIQA